MLWTVVAVVAALLLGLLAGYVLYDSDETSVPAAMAVDGDELTDRQEEMLELLDDYSAAWRAGDGEAAEAMFTSNGVLTYGKDYLASDGGLAAFIDAIPTPRLEMLEPVLLSGSTMISFHELTPEGATRQNLMEFTATGEVRLIKHEITN